MNIICDREKLLESITNVSRAVSTKSTLPTLEGILLKTKKDKLYMAGYDLEIGITTYIDVNVVKEGEIVLEARLFNEIIRRLPDPKVSISVDDRLVTTITSGSAQFSIMGISSSEFPEIPTITNGTPVEINQGILKSMIRQTIFAVSTSESKPVHTGSLFELSKDNIKIVAVDGYRLALRKEKIKNSENMSFVVPGKTLNELLKLLTNDEKSIEMVVGKRHIIFAVEEYSVITRLLEGEFLDYNAAIPSDHKTEVVANKRLFLESIERASLLITDRLKSPVKCTFDKDELLVSCSTTLGKINDKIPIEAQGEKVFIGFNNRYLLDALRAAETDVVKITLSGPLSPMKILPPQGDSFLFLVLPVRLKND